MVSVCRSSAIPSSVTSGLIEIGHAIKAARLRRRRSAADIASRSGVSLPTYRKIERGDPTVSLSVFATTLWVMGLFDNLKDALQPENDKLAANLETERLPQRARRSRAKGEVNLDEL